MKEDWNKLYEAQFNVNTVYSKVIDVNKPIKTTFIKTIYYKIRYYIWEIKRFIDYIKDYK